MTPEEKISRMQAISAERTEAKKKKLKEDYAVFKSALPDVAELVEWMKNNGTPVVLLEFRINGQESIKLR